MSDPPRDAGSDGATAHVGSSVEPPGPAMPDPAPGMPRAWRRRARRRQVWRRLRRRLAGVLLCLPMLAGVTALLLLPSGALLWQSVDNPLLAVRFPVTSAALQAWEPARRRLPPEAAFAALARELKAARDAAALGLVAERMEPELAGIGPLLRGTGRGLRSVDVFEAPPHGSWRAALLDLDPRWGDAAYWAALRHHAAPHSVGYYLRALDLRYAIDGAVEVRTGAPSAPHAGGGQGGVGLWRSLAGAALIAALCLPLAYPTAYLLASARPRFTRLALGGLLLCLFASPLIGATAWLALLQRLATPPPLAQWPLQWLQQWAGALAGTLASAQSLLPLAILALYAALRGIAAGDLRAARSLGASPWRALWLVYLPQTRAAALAAAALIFALALGRYVAPVLLDGGAPTLAARSLVIAASSAPDPGLMAALAVLLFAAALLALWLARHTLRELLIAAPAVFVELTAGAARVPLPGALPRRLAGAGWWPLGGWRWLRRWLVRGALRGLGALVLLGLFAPLAAVPLLAVHAAWAAPRASTRPLPGGDWLPALFNSLGGSLLAALLATLFGGAAALGLLRFGARWRRRLGALLLAPLLLPLVASAAALHWLLTMLQLVHSPIAPVLAHALLGAPLALLAVATRAAAIDPELRRAALGLGASRWSAWRRVHLPLLAPGFAAGALLAFAASLGEVVLAQLLAGVQERSLSWQLWFGLRARAAADTLDPALLFAASLLLLFALLALWALARLWRRPEVAG